MNIKVICSILGILVLTISLSSYQQQSFAEELKIDMTLDTNTIIFQDVNNNEKLDKGEPGTILGKLFASGTKDQIGEYRCSFVGAGWVNSTDSTPVTIATRTLDFGTNGTIAAVGDEVTPLAPGKPVVGVIAGGTGDFMGIYGEIIEMPKEVVGNEFPVELTINYGKSN